MILYPTLELLFAVTIPAYNSFKALKAKKNKEISFWATYWVSYSAFKMCTFVLDKVVFWVPFYWMGKLLVVLWLSGGGGAAVVGERVIFPWLKQNERRIDRLSTAVTHWVKESGKRLLGAAVVFLQQQINSADNREQASEAFRWLVRASEANEQSGESGQSSGNEEE